MQDKLRYVGLDVHADTIVIAVAEADRTPAKVLATVAHEWTALQTQLRKLASSAQLMICYEAGPTGFQLCRQLRNAGYDCQVIAPSLVPKKSGVRMKTDRRDAAALAHFLRSGDLTQVWVPDEACEALRDLSRAREAAKRAELAARQQLGKFLLRHGRRWEKSTWTVTHLAWIGQQAFAQPAQQRVLADHLQAVLDATARVQRLENALAELAPQLTQLWPIICALQAFRGIALISAVTIISELGDLKRFGSARQLMAYLGLVPSEHSTGLTKQRGSITKSGNSHVRRILVEAAHHAPRVTPTSKALRKRREGLAPGVVRIANQAQQRLQSRFYALVQKGKAKSKVVVAIARELAGFIWALGQESSLLAAVDSASPGEGTSRTPRSLPPGPQPPSPLLCVPQRDASGVPSRRKPARRGAAVVRTR